MKAERMITIIGPTASGKTGRAVMLAEDLGGEIISGDSRQVYRGMDLGTGKDIEEYGDIPYHLIDVCEAGEKYNLHRFLYDFSKAYKDILERGVTPVFCGGTGLYVESALSGIILPEVPENKELRESLKNKNLEELTEILKSMKSLHNSTDIDTEKRAIRAIEIEKYYLSNPDTAIKADRKQATPLDSLIIGIDIPREERRKRITERLDKRLDSGMINEVKLLLEKGVSPEDLIYYGLEYKFLTLHVIGRLSFDEMRNQLEIAIHQFAKRQMTWFRGMERRGFKINWLPFDMPRKEFINTVVSLNEN
ncbi:MAG: tRNA (adenosine(37)-N6)-dimethylallyltransferase MiaA [Muribaculaceae bacterium]|nr:tRNA (adenosine(37)-N6)-dimethylallyltransferase MiaA [Muribaculaceae bacterium]